MLRGGGAAFGPKPRDFSTELPRKIYDLAWRTALSYRYSRGELIVVDRLHILDEEPELHMMEGEELEDYLYENQRTWNDRPKREPPELRMPGTEREVLRTAEYLKMFRQGEEKLRSLFVVKEADEKKKKQFQLRLWKEGKFKDIKTVDLKNLLELDRIVIEKAALDSILRMRQRDLKPPVNVVAAQAQAEKDAKILKEALDEMKSSTEAKQTS
jgi:large subunit ribosomal protein L4